MNKILAFILSFKNEASEGLMKARKDFLSLEKATESMSKAWEKWGEEVWKSYDKVTKAGRSLVRANKNAWKDIKSDRELSQKKISELDVALRKSVGLNIKSITKLGSITAVLGFTTNAAFGLANATRDVAVQADLMASELAKLGPSIISIGHEARTSTSSVSELMSLLMARGIKGADLDQLTTSILKFSHITKISSLEAGEFVARMMKKFGLTASESEDFLASLMKVAKRSVATYKNMLQGVKSFEGEIIQITGPMQKKVLLELAASIGALREPMEDLTGPTLNFMKSLRDISEGDKFSKISRAVAYLKGNFDELRSAAVAGNIAVVTEGLIKMAHTMGTLDPRQFRELQSYMEDLTGLSIEFMRTLEKVPINSINRLNRALVPTGGGAKEIADQFEKAFISSDEIRNIWNEINRILAPAGESFEKALGKGAEALREIAGYVEKLNKANPGLVKAGGLLLGIGSSLLLIKSTLGLLIGPLYFSNPVLLGLTGLFMGIILAIENWDKVSQDLKNTWGEINQTFKDIGEGKFFTATLDRWGDQVVDLGNKFRNVLGIEEQFRSTLEDRSSLTEALRNQAYYIHKSRAALLKYNKEHGTSYKSLEEAIQSRKPASIFDKVDPKDPLQGEKFNVTPPSPIKKKGYGFGGMIMPRSGGVDINVSERGKPEIIGDPEQIKRYFGSNEIVAAIQQAAMQMVSAIESGSRTAPEPVALPITPQSFNSHQEAPSPSDRGWRTYVR